jgi:hypothetical protein
MRLTVGTSTLARWALGRVARTRRTERLPDLTFPWRRARWAAGRAGVEVLVVAVCLVDDDGLVDVCDDVVEDWLVVFACRPDPPLEDELGFELARAGELDSRLTASAMPATAPGTARIWDRTTD